MLHLRAIDKIAKLFNGFWTVLDCDKNPIEGKDLFMQSQLDNTFAKSRSNAICCLRLNIVSIWTYDYSW